MAASKSDCPEAQMRIGSIIAAATLVCLSACSVVPREAYTFDPTHPQAKPAMSVAEAAALTDRMAQLQLEKNAIRTRIANEPDALVRQRHYEALHVVGMQLSPVERRLAMYSSSR
jgi:hypothetical protein